jgi:hypothetical protein
MRKGWGGTDRYKFFSYSPNPHDDWQQEHYGERNPKRKNAEEISYDEGEKVFHSIKHIHFYGKANFVGAFE